ncbi:ornithine cyclodeaminase [Sphingomonas sp. BLCC-B65]|nr:ornithine cyclodeaminase [Sphingomonas sp. BLCC-B65]
MTAFVGVGSMARFIAQHGPARIIGELVDYLEADFRRWPVFEKAARVASHTPFGVIELMPITDYDEYAFKYVNGHPTNPARGFQTVTAFGVLADVHNGYPVFVAEMTLLTALRTAATSALASRALARPDSDTMALIGTGSQAEFQALAFREVLGIRSLRIWDTDPDAMAKLVRNLAPRGFDVVVCRSAGEATEGADVVTTCTADKSAATVLSEEDVHPGVHINAIGGDCPGKTELDPAILDRADVFVEYPPQTRIEGEIQNKPADFPVTELWRVLTRETVGRHAAAQVTLFDSVGFAMEDFSALRYARDRLSGTSLCTDIDLIASPEDPKDLFGSLPQLVPIG